MKPIIISITNFIKDFGDFSLSAIGAISIVFGFLIKKLFDYLMFKSDIKALKEIVKAQNTKLEALSEKLSKLLENQQGIHLDVELIKQDLEHSKSNFTKRQVIFRNKKI